MLTPWDIVKQMKERAVEVVDFKFVDLPGNWQHMSIPAHLLTERFFEEGIGFDGSSVRGFQDVNESDMLLRPDPSTAFIDPFMSPTTLSLICNVFDPLSKKPYSRDPRFVAQKAEQYLRSTPVADTAYFGPEAEFYIFDSVRYASTDNVQYAEIDSVEAHWNSKGRNDKPNLGHFMHQRQGYFPVPPDDTYQNLRTEMMLHLKKLGMPVEGHHHEVGAPGQTEIRIHYGSLLETADRVLLYKYVTKNVARQHGKSVTFMPKPVLGDNGSGMHTHQSLWKRGQPLFYDASDEYAGISRLARYYIGGILKHTPAILAIAAPTTNSYKRLVPGFEAPVNLVFSKGNRSAAIRIPLTNDAEAKRIEFRPSDPTANPYLLFSALLLAGLDGIARRIDPELEGFGPDDRNFYRDNENFGSVPRSLEESLSALETDFEFLLAGDVFTTDLIKKYIEIKREQADLVRLCPAPIEFSLYYGG